MTNPHGQKEEHDEAEHMRIGRRQSSPESGEELVGDSKSLEGLGLGTDREGERVRGRPTGLSRFGQAHLGGLTGGPRLSASLLI
jgi:hypothetical protein